MRYAARRPAIPTPTRLLGESKVMGDLRGLIARAAASDITVLIRGETGTGKELVARAIHEGSSHHQGPFVPVNCGGLTLTLLESLLFGHERGAFTGADRRVRGAFEQAAHGTLFLDEIGEMPLVAQATLLRVLDDRRIRVVGAEQEMAMTARVIAATNADLEVMVAERRFRADLYHRIDVGSIEVPSLAERRTDIPLLAKAFAEQHSRRLVFSDEAMEWLQCRAWPGNVRELRNVIQRLSTFSSEDIITEAVLEKLVRPVRASPLHDLARSVLDMPVIGSRLKHAEDALIAVAMKRASGCKAEAARLLNVERKVIDRRVKQTNV